MMPYRVGKRSAVLRRLISALESVTEPVTLRELSERACCSLGGLRNASYSSALIERGLMRQAGFVRSPHNNRRVTTYLPGSPP